MVLKRGYLATTRISSQLPLPFATLTTHSMRGTVYKRGHYVILEGDGEIWSGVFILSMLAYLGR